MSDYELHQTRRRHEDILRHGGHTGGGFYWLLAAGFVLLLIVSLFLFGDATTPVDGEIVAPELLQVEPVAPTAPTVTPAE